MTKQQIIANFDKNECKLLNILLPSGEFTASSQYDYYDALSDQHKLIIECKCRRFSYKYFNTKYNGSFLLELDKAKHLFKKANELKYKPVYVFSFIDYGTKNINYWSALTLSKIDFKKLKIEKRRCPKNEFDEVIEYVWKDCFIIPRSMLNAKNCTTKFCGTI